MKKLILLIIIIISISLSGCLNFGKDEETTSPTPAQVSRCYSEMYLNPDLKIHPLGYKLEGSGIDDAIWFKFETDAAVSEIFNSTVIDTTKFTQNYTLLYEIKGLKWWDIKGKSLLGGQIELPNVRYMNVGIEKKGDSNLVYIMWHET
jgi:hypothetical protein